MTRVLFVDDEPNVLRAIERVWRVKRPPWSAAFAPSGDRALAILAEEPVDIIVSDLNMPGMDGIALLTAVRSRHPHVARVVLSGRSGDASDPALHVAHQWLSKPCDMAGLLGRIERLARAQALVDDPLVRAGVGGLAALRSPARVHREVMQGLAAKAPLPSIAALIETDPAVVAKLLQLASSPLFSIGGGVVVSVTRAVAVLGGALVQTVLLAPELFRSGGDRDPSRDRLVAQLAHAIAPPDVAAEALVAGVLHRVGTVAASELNLPTAASERDARIGGLLLGMWGLSATLVDAVAYHRDPASASDPDAPVLRALATAAALGEELSSEVAPTPVTWLTADELAAHRETARQLWRAS